MTITNIPKRIGAVLSTATLTTVITFLCISGGKAETPSVEAKEKLIEQCIRQMTETNADGAGKAMAFRKLQELGPDAKSAVPALVKALDHEEDYIRVQSAYTLWKVEPQTKAIIALAKMRESAEDSAMREAAAAILKKIDEQLGKEFEAKTSGENDSTAHAEMVATAFITALANNDLDEAVQYILPAERDEIKKGMEQGMPPLPKDPKIQVKIKKNGIQADVSLLNAQKPESGPPIGFDMKLSEGKWWIVK
ncbi:MAG: HEAT repeat domain-containing protein [Verrucomicrobiae bacterium]|nr:HEAT repeat domain-containing protein [Verrucomicrobiae bacterium]NNJ87170.1 HEAT repeat domain-containing protein [Akkermansiaceae bacterium]